MHREIERTYSPMREAPVPDLHGLPGVVEVGACRVDELSAVYFDTEDLRLVRAGVTLRRRTGGPDEGWHLKVPVDEGRDELQLPLGRATRVPPAELRDAVQGWARGAPLEPVATIDTRRTTYPLVGADQIVLAELADDEVSGTRADGASVAWREWEIELVSGQVALLDAADRLLAEVGVETAAVQRKIAQVLGDRMPAPVRLRRPRPGKPAARVIHARLAAQVDELGRADVAARRGDAEGVHRARVACRRLRSVLATFRPLLDADVCTALRAELQWLTVTLGQARDAAVAHQRLSRLLAEEPPVLVIGPVAERLRATYARPEGVAEVLGSERYLALRQELDLLVAAPPWTELADEPAGEVLPRRVEKEWRRLQRSYDAVAGAEHRDAAMHEVRKAAKRLRYAAETVQPVVADAGRTVVAARELTSYLGERQDTVASREHLLALAEAAAAAGEPTFTYGRMHAREERHADEFDAGLADEWERIIGPARRSTC